MRITLLKGGGGDTYYELGLLSGLIERGIKVEFIGSDHMKNAEILNHRSVKFLNLRGVEKSKLSIFDKILNILKYYLKLIVYAASTDSKLFHIQWFDRLIHFERIFMILYYKRLGKKLVYTAHNINAGERDGTDNFINRMSLEFLYKNIDHIIVHTNAMKKQLVEDFKIENNKISVIQHGINSAVPISEISRFRARKLLRLGSNDKIMLFFGNITTYKGLEYLIHALNSIKDKIDSIKLIIAGRIKRNEEYWSKIEKIINRYRLENFIMSRTEYIPDEDIEIYFKSADVLILPYKFIFQSGPLFLAYNFGIPVIATDVGSFKEDIIEGKTGFICRPEDPKDLAKKIEVYFQSDLYKNLESNRNEIIAYANEKYSWENIGKKTIDVYRKLNKEKSFKAES